MHYITAVEYDAEYRLYLQFENEEWRAVDLNDYLDGEVFEPLKNVARFATAELNEDLDTVVWGNGADMSPDFLFKISVPAEHPPVMKAAEESVSYETRSKTQ